MVRISAEQIICRPTRLCQAWRICLTEFPQKKENLRRRRIKRVRPQGGCLSAYLRKQGGILYGYCVLDHRCHPDHRSSVPVPEELFREPQDDKRTEDPGNFPDCAVRHFFVLCLSDVLDIKVSFSAVRVFLNIFYSLAFLSLSAFALSNLRMKKRVHMQIIVSTCAALIAVQCFIFPYGSAGEVKRICEAVEGIIVFTLLVLMIPRISDEKYSQKALWIIIALEFAVAVLNTVLPMPSVTEDIQSSDIPMNYLALYMRPVILSSLALVHHVWLDLQKTDDSGIHGRAPKDVKKG